MKEIHRARPRHVDSGQILVRRGAMMRASLLALSVLLLSSASVLAQTSRTTPAACDALQKLQLDGVAVTILKTQWMAAGAPLPAGRAGGPAPAASNLPAYC